TGGKVPYAFDRMLLNERDEPQGRIKRGEKSGKPHGWHCVLTPTEDPEQIETARWLFRNYDEREVSFRTLAKEVNERGIPGPAAPKTWTRGAFRGILENPHYVGDADWGEMNYGRFCRVVNGDPTPVTIIAKSPAGNPRKHKNTEGLV